MDFFTDGLSIPGSFMTMTQLRINPIELKKDMKEPARPYQLNPPCTSPPLYFSFGFQLLTELSIWRECGHVCMSWLLKWIQTSLLIESTETYYIDMFTINDIWKLLFKKKKNTLFLLVPSFSCWRHWRQTGMIM